MYKNKEIIRKKIRIINGVKVPTEEMEVASYNSLSVEAGTTGYKGGNASHGGRTYIKVIDLGGTDMNIQKDGEGKGFVVRLSGDSELTTTIKALEFILKTLKTQSANESSVKTAEDDSSNSPKTVINETLPATKKQIKFLVSLLDKSDYRLKDKLLTRKDAGELIELLRGPDKANIPSKYEKFIEKIF